MRRTLLLISMLILAAGGVANAVDFGPLTVGVHVIPAVEAGEGDRHWDLSLSLGIGLTLDVPNRFEIHALTDSHLTSLGLTALYYGRITDRLTGGGGVTVLWPLGEQQKLLKPIVEAFALAAVEYTLGPILRGGFEVSFPLLAVAHRLEGWEIIALAELPSFSLMSEFDVSDGSVFRGRATLQPVITDTTLLESPIWPIGDNLLVLPSFSGYIRFLP